MMSSNLSKVNGSNHEVSSEATPAADRSGRSSNLLLGSVIGGYNTQLLTHYGYYLSPKPAIQQLKK